MSDLNRSPRPPEVSRLQDRPGRQGLHGTAGMRQAAPLLRGEVILPRLGATAMGQGLVL